MIFVVRCSYPQEHEFRDIFDQFEFNFIRIFGVESASPTIYSYFNKHILTDTKRAEPSSRLRWRSSQKCVLVNRRTFRVKINQSINIRPRYTVNARLSKTLEVSITDWRSGLYISPSPLTPVLNCIHSLPRLLPSFFSTEPRELEPWDKSLTWLTRSDVGSSSLVLPAVSTYEILCGNTMLSRQP